MRTLSKEFFNKIIKKPNYTILKSNGKWNTRNDVGKYINSCILKLKEYNIQKGDRVFYKGGNSVEWLSWNMATNTIGGIFVPVYENQKDSYYHHILHDCSPRLIVSKENSTMDTKIPNISNKVEKEEGNYIENFVQNDISTIIYTSGTTGNPKGVVLTNENILSNIDSIHQMFSREPPMKSLNILPWTHIYGQTCELYYNLLNENQIVLCLDKQKFITDCRKEKPTILFVVPKILEMIYNKVSVFERPGTKWVIPYLVKELLGGNIKYIFCGGASLSMDIVHFFQKNGVIICQGYGCSETSPMVSLNHYSYPRNERSVGEILENVNVEIINGEICVNGPNVMSGYWKNEDYTSKVFVEKNGKKYYKTGDLGFVRDGFLYYEGRKSENYKLNNGKFVNIMELENKVKKLLPKDTNFMIFEKNGVNCMVYDGNCICVESINSNIEKHLEIKSIYLMERSLFQQFLTPKMSIKRKSLRNYIICNF